MSQRAIFARTKAGHKEGKSHHCLRLILAKLARKPFILDNVPERGYGFGIRAVGYVILFRQEPIPELSG